MIIEMNRNIKPDILEACKTKEIRLWYLNIDYDIVQSNCVDIRLPDHTPYVHRSTMISLKFNNYTLHTLRKPNSTIRVIASSENMLKYLL